MDLSRPCNASWLIPLTSVSSRVMTTPQVVTESAVQPLPSSVNVTFTAKPVPNRRRSSIGEGLAMPNWALRDYCIRRCRSTFARVNYRLRMREVEFGSGRQSRPVSNCNRRHSSFVVVGLSYFLLTFYCNVNMPAIRRWE